MDDQEVLDKTQIQKNHISGESWFKKSSVLIIGVRKNKTGFSPEEPAVVAYVLSTWLD